MSDLELEALTQIVRRETAIIEMQVKRYGEIQSDPDTAASRELYRELMRRDILEA